MVIRVEFENLQYPYVHTFWVKVLKSIILIIIGIVIGISVMFIILVSSEIAEELKPHPCLALWDDPVREIVMNYKGDMRDLTAEEFLKFGELNCMNTLGEWLPVDHQDVEFFRELGL